MIKLPNKKIIIQSVLLSSLINLLLLAFFKKFRGIIPPPEINRDGLIGFPQYFGYPLYFETLYFYLLIFAPVLTFLILFIINKIYERHN